MQYSQDPHPWLHTCRLSHFNCVQLFVRTALLCPWDSQGKDIGVGCHFLLQGIFSTLGLNLCLLHRLHWLAGSLPLEPPRKSLIPG